MNNYKIGETDTRPWGNYRVLAVGEKFVVKEITVNSGGILSLQRHQHRAEHWIIISGEAVVTLDCNEIPLGKDESVFIHKTAWHRIENRAFEPLIFIEVQTGDILDEADIERREDKYNRIDKLTRLN